MKESEEVWADTSSSNANGELQKAENMLTVQNQEEVMDDVQIE